MSWLEQANTLSNQWQFADFKQAWAFASQCALLFEKHDHHPDITVGWGKVSITTTTHDAGNKVTAKDHDLAAAIDALGAQ